MDSKHTPEPWPYFWDRNDILASSVDPESGPVVMLTPLDYERARASVNACAGMDDPTVTIAALRADRKELEAIRADKVLFLPRPGYSKGAISINLSVAEQEGAIRDKLAEMGWARPDEAKQLRAENARLRDGLTLALRVAESWTHDQLDGTGSFDEAWAELEPARAALRGGEGV